MVITDKIYAIVSNLSKGGAQVVFVNVINELWKKKYNIEVIVQNLDDAVILEKLDRDIPINNMEIKEARHLYGKLKQFLDKQEFSKLLIFSPEISVIAYIYEKLSRKKFIIISRCGNNLSKEYTHNVRFFRKYVTHTLIRLMYHHVDLAIAQSKGMAEDMINNYSFKRNRLTVINNFVGQEYQNEICDCGISEKSNIILYIGRLEEQKGLFMLFDAFKKLNDKKVKLLLVGEGTQKQELIDYSIKLKIDSRVEFKPYFKNPIEYYKKSRVVVLSSYFEGFPNVLIEAIACGTPVVAYDLPNGPNEIIVNNVNGYLANYLDINDLAKKIDHCLEKIWDTNIIKNSAKKFTMKEIIGKYEEVLNMKEQHTII